MTLYTTHYKHVYDTAVSSTLHTTLHYTIYTHTHAYLSIMPYIPKPEPGLEHSQVVEDGRAAEVQQAPQLL